MDIIELGLSYFDNDVPTAKLFCDEVWRPNYINFNSDEKKAINFMLDYSRCYHNMAALSIRGHIFKREYWSVINNANDVNALLSRPFDIEAFKKMHTDAIANLKVRDDERAADRKTVVDEAVAKSELHLTSFDMRRAHITALMAALEADIKEFNNDFGDEHISLSTTHALYGENGNLVIVDAKPDADWKGSDYSFNSETHEISKIKYNVDTDCDCDCCNDDK